MEISGLYDCFFRFVKFLDLLQISADRAMFLQSVLLRHASNADLVQALAWASVDKVKLPGGGGASDLANNPIRIGSEMSSRSLIYRAVRLFCSAVRKW